MLIRELLLLVLRRTFNPFINIIVVVVAVVVVIFSFQFLDAEDKHIKYQTIIDDMSIASNCMSQFVMLRLPEGVVNLISSRSLLATGHCGCLTCYNATDEASDVT
jgi:hypothetical protein